LIEGRLKVVVYQIFACGESATPKADAPLAQIFDVALELAPTSNVTLTAPMGKIVGVENFQPLRAQNLIQGRLHKTTLQRSQLKNVVKNASWVIIGNPFRSEISAKVLFMESSDCVAGE